MRIRPLLVVAGAAALAAAGARQLQRVLAETRELEPAGAEFLDSAPVKNSLTVPLPASAEAVFAVLEDATAWPRWLGGIDKVVWKTDTGLGATRTIHAGPFVADEFFFDWDQGRSMTFRFTESNFPMFDALVERWEVEPISDAESKLTWRYGFRCTERFALAEDVVGQAFEANARRSLDHLAEFLRSHGDRYTSAGRSG